LQFNPNYSFLYHNFKVKGNRIFVLQGGSRSGKTYSTLQYLIRICYENKGSGIVISIVRNTFPSLRATVMRDFFDILLSMGAYTEANHDKSEHTYNLWGNLVEFFSVDDEQKIRGRKRDILFMNEANEISREKYVQLMLRTTGKVIMDYNPSMMDSYIYDEVLTRPDCLLKVTTYKDNPHLSKGIVFEIERMELVDPDGWKIFGLGQRGQIAGLIFPSITEVDLFPDIPFGFGMDFGFSSDPTTLIKVGIRNDELFIDEYLWRSGLTTPEINTMLKTLLVGRSEIVADSAEPRLIEELKRMGWNIWPSIKGQGSIKQGIDTIKRYRINVTKRSVNTLKEFRNYKWKQDSNGIFLDEPIDYWNHGIDSIRYRMSRVTWQQPNRAARVNL